MPSAKLRILETTDLHMELLGFDYFSNSERSDRGFMRIANLIAEQRREGISTLLCDNGDFIQGTPLADHCFDHLEPENHPMVNLMNELDYDAITLGNHDLDYGLEFLKSLAGAIDAPILCCNLEQKHKGRIFRPWSILEKTLECDDGVSRNLRIGIIGALPPQSADWNRHTLSEDIECQDIVDSIRADIPAITASGADIIIVLSHSGIGGHLCKFKMENALLPISEIPELDVLLFGHTHQPFPIAGQPTDGAINHTQGTVNGKPAISAGAHARFLGKIDLDLSIDNEKWQITDHECSLIPSSNDRASIVEILKKPTNLDIIHRDLTETLAEPITDLNGHVTSYFTAAGFDQSTKIVARSMAAHSPKTLDRPILFAASPFRAGGRAGPNNYIDFKNGVLSLGDVKSMLPFNNPMCVAKRTGKQLREWLAYTSNFFQVITPHQGPQQLLNDDFPSFNFDIFTGIRYSFDLSHPSNSIKERVPSIKFQEREVADTDEFYVAASSYRASGGGGLPKIAQNDIVWTSELGMTDFLLAYLKSQKTLHVDNGPNWEFAPINGASGIFESSPTAKELTQAKQPIWQKDRADGFSLYEVQF